MRCARASRDRRLGDSRFTVTIWVWQGERPARAATWRATPSAPPGTVRVTWPTTWRASPIRLRSLPITEASTFERRPHAKRLVAIVTPMHRFPLSEDEQISVRHLREHLGGFDRYMIGPQIPPKEFSDFASPPLSARLFADRAGYNNLLLSEQFYRAFAEYEYILIYQLDCLVFSSNLEEWCRKGWDYVGAPWFDGYSRDGWDYLGPPWHDGGVAVRQLRISRRSGRRIWDSRKRRILAAKGRYGSCRADFRQAAFVRSSDGRSFNISWDLTRTYSGHSARRSWWTRFRIPKPREALKFSFETEPRYCYQENAGRLPFGCHAWPVYEREFWEPFLLK